VTASGFPQAAHIRAVAEGGEHRLDNGLLPRSDVHTLFDRGYLAVDSRHRLLVTLGCAKTSVTAISSTPGQGKSSSYPSVGPTGRTAASWNGTSMESSWPRRAARPAG
jgi:HNH endonuclease